MAIDERLASRVRSALSAHPAVQERKMFGGLAFLVHGNMSVGVQGADLIVRVDPSETDEALTRSGVRLFDMTGRPMKGWLLISPEALHSDSALGEWVGRGVAYAESLPPK
jgi:TfoX/Sxy family transcriptional regulator of competence genes